MIIEPVTLEGRAVRLEPLSLDHLDALLEAGADRDLAIHAIELLQLAMRCAAHRDRFGMAASPGPRCRSLRSTAVGQTDRQHAIQNIVPEHKRVEIGWTWISPPWQRSAINTEAKYLMIRHAFEQMGCNRVELKTTALNVRSRAAILRIGAQEEGTLRSHMINPDGTLRDTGLLQRNRARMA